MSDNLPGNKNSKFGVASLGFEGWYHLLSRNLCECLNQSELCSHWTKVFAFLSLPAGERAMPVSQSAVVSSWLPGKGTLCAFHGPAPERQKHHRGEEVQAPGSRHEHS